jgi:lipopolysaccharide biosynthesis protein
MLLSFPRAWGRRGHNFVKRTRHGQRTLDDVSKVTIFVHFDRGGRVHDYIIYYLEALQEAGYEIVFVSNGRDLEPVAIARIEPLCAAILERRNIGYDFGAYRDGLAFLGDLSRFEEVILANDSVYGPLFDLRQVLTRCDSSASVWGMTDSWDIRYHLQSFFLVIGNDALRHPKFTAFWRDLLPTQSKQMVVRRHEVGFTQAMLRAGLSCAALFPYRDAANDLMAMAAGGTFSGATIEPPIREFLKTLHSRVLQGVPFNPLHQFFDHMIRFRRCPFIKRELLARNPCRIPHVHVWERLISSVSNYDTELIVRHMQSVVRNRAP